MKYRLTPIILKTKHAGADAREHKHKCTHTCTHNVSLMNISTILAASGLTLSCQKSVRDPVFCLELFNNTHKESIRVQVRTHH